MRLFKLSIVLSACAVLTACGTSRRELLAVSKSQLQLRSIQTRAFETTDREKTLRTVIATMQDLGFVIDDANYTLGSVSGTKLDNFQLRMTVTVRPRGTTQLLVRAGMQFNLTQVDDPEPYQQFFTALGRAMFLEAQEAEIKESATPTRGLAYSGPEVAPEIPQTHYYEEQARFTQGGEKLPEQTEAGLEEKHPSGAPFSAPGWGQQKWLKPE